MYDLIIIGSGPAGLSAALAARRIGLSCLVLERGVIGDTVYHFPIARPLFSTSNEIELESGALPTSRKPTREEVLAHYAQVVAKERIDIRTGETVTAIEPWEDAFVVSTAVSTGEGTYRARAVLVATGGFGRQRTLNVPGECAERVSYRFIEAPPYAEKRVLVIGGGNSAAEAAVFLAEAGAEVTLAIRRESLAAPSRMNAAKIKPWVLEPLERFRAAGRIHLIASAELVRIDNERAQLATGDSETPGLVEVRCDHVFALIGADPDFSLLERAGVEIAADGRPVYSAEYETNIPGLFVAGHLTRELHMKRAIAVGTEVVRHIKQRLAASAEALQTV